MSKPNKGQRQSVDSAIAAFNQYQQALKETATTAAALRDGLQRVWQMTAEAEQLVHEPFKRLCHPTDSDMRDPAAVGAQWVIVNHALRCFHDLCTDEAAEKWPAWLDRFEFPGDFFGHWRTALRMGEPDVIGGMLVDAWTCDPAGLLAMLQTVWTEWHRANPIDMYYHRLREQIRQAPAFPKTRPPITASNESLPIAELNDSLDDKEKMTFTTLSATVRSHAPGFASVTWYGTYYTFTKTQRPIIKMLWEALKNGTPEVDLGTLLIEAECESHSMAEVFRDHAALDTMIVRGDRRDTYKLKIPTAADN